MKLRNTLIVCIGLLAAMFYGGWATAQAASETSSIETINVTAARPVARALDVIEKRYGVQIDYVDAPVVSPQDTQIVRFVRGTPVRKPYLIARVRTIRTSYSGTGGKPQNGITALIQQVLSEFAASGGPVFAVRKLTMPSDPRWRGSARWEVYPTVVRNRSGTFEEQPDVLSAVINIPTKDRTLAEMLGEICEQLTARWGVKFGVASAPANVFFRYHCEMGADNVTARRALLDLMGPTLVLKLFYDPDDGEYAVNIVNLPYRQPPRPLPPPPTPPPQFGPKLEPGAKLARIWLTLTTRNRTGGIIDFQTALTKAGYLHAPATGRWDKNTADALRRFQSASGLPPTGRLDIATVVKLEPFLRKLNLRPPPHPTSSLMFPALAFWLSDTPLGQKEVQEALAKAGFYSGPINGEFDLKTTEALKTFQAANGLPPNGIFDYPTAEKLAPFLPRR